MAVVAPPGADLGEPGAIRTGDRAEDLFDPGMHEDAGDLGIARGAADQRDVGGTEALRIDRPGALAEHRRGRQRLALFFAQTSLGRRREPDVRIEAGLVRGVAAEHGPAPWLGEVAHEQPRPSVAASLAREPLDERDQARMTESPIARRSHRLPIGTIGGKSDGPGETTARGKADRPDRSGHRRGRGVHAPEELFRRRRLLGRAHTGGADDADREHRSDNRQGSEPGNSSRVWPKSR